MTLDWSQLVTITTPRLQLRAIRTDDVDDFYAVYSNPEVMRYWSTPPLPNREAANKDARGVLGKDLCLRLIVLDLGIMFVELESHLCAVGHM